MSSELMLDVGQAQELKLAFRREGPWTNEEIKMLTERKGFLTQVREALYGRSEIKPVEYTVDLDAPPFIPKGWVVETHLKGGRFKFGDAKVTLYSSENQRIGKCAEVTELQKELESQTVLNANLLDFYLAHPNIIPENWKGKHIYFQGTVYRHTCCYRCVRYLCWNRWSDSQWCWDFSAIEFGKGLSGPVAVSSK